MELDSIYQNIEHEDVKDTRGPQIQSQSQDEGQKQKQMQHISITAERESLSSSYKNLQDNYTDLTLKNLDLETELRKLYEQGKGRFFISSETKSWSESRQYCRAHGGDLVIINTEEKQRFISSLVKEIVWIGLTDIEKEGNMKWVNNSPLKQGYWEENEPNNSGGEDCIELDPAKPVLNNWNDNPCSEMTKCVCENFTSVPASS
ncbi:C-type lectin domain family 4 member M-like isoform X2 [Ctenopharyngodon idella]|uniref:C-type lectin domain family 4 member M-like isoform X2 n=1 Tax=Ctenopharyngodon idella TaxID=7959 RepID=UPI0022302053|nr:C-type lectin domain family 4 member M-like isoform X2 [Ctenopharyngodon idella]